MKTVLFLIPTLGGGGAEKVLVNLANNLDKTKYDVTVQTIFKNDVHSSSLNKDVKFVRGKVKAFRGNVVLSKLFSPAFLYRTIVKKRYDIVIAYLEGLACRIVAGCPYDDVKKMAFVHIKVNSTKSASYCFRNIDEMNKLYNRFDVISCCAETVKQGFENAVKLDKPCIVLYNVNETEDIVAKSNMPLENFKFSDDINLISVGRLVKQKGFDRLINVHKRLLDEGIKNYLYILGEGDLRSSLEKQVEDLNVQDTVHFLGFQTNPYHYVANADLFVCSSIEEGFSTAVTESLVVGTPIVSTNCSGAYELLGYANEYGIVTENNEDALYDGVYNMLVKEGKLAYYKERAKERGSNFSKSKTIEAVEKVLDNV